MGSDDSNSNQSTGSWKSLVTTNRDFYEPQAASCSVLVRGYKPLLPNMRDLAFAEIEELVRQANKNVVFDFSGMNQLGKEWNWVLVQLVQSQKARDLRVAVANASPPLMAYLKAQGLDGAILVEADVASVRKKLGLDTCQERTKVDVEIINPFLGGLVQIFETQMNFKPEVGKVFIRGAEEKSLGDLCGIIEVNCPNLSGLVVFSFPISTIRKFVEMMHGKEEAENPAFVTDSIGEITNIAFTRGKTELNARGFGIKAALPTTCARDQVSEGFTRFRGPSITVPFKSPIGEFFAEIKLAA